MKPSAAGHFALDDGAGSIKLEYAFNGLLLGWIRHRLDFPPVWFCEIPAARATGAPPFLHELSTGK